MNPETITIRKPDDFHLHLRQGSLLDICAPESAKWFERALIMPNTLPPVDTPQRLQSYRKEIISSAHTLNPSFTPIMTFKLLPGMTAENIIQLRDAGAAAGKLYPAGSTTNSADGVASLNQIESPLAAMEQLGLVLCIHAEKPDAFCLEREKEYLPELQKIMKKYPALKVVLEHVSSREGVDAVKNGPDTLRATITPHHLLLTLDDLLGEGINPHNFCKPLVKTPADRKAVQEAALSGSGRFFFGSDSAPHLPAAKLSSSGSAGIYSAPSALPLLADFFHTRNRLDLLEDFTSRFGAEFYNLPLNSTTLTLVRGDFFIPNNIGPLVPLLAGKPVSWGINC